MEGSVPCLSRKISSNLKEVLREWREKSILVGWMSLPCPTKQVIQCGTVWAISVPEPKLCLVEAQEKGSRCFPSVPCRSHLHPEKT